MSNTFIIAVIYIFQYKIVVKKATLSNLSNYLELFLIQKMAKQQVAFEELPLGQKVETTGSLLAKRAKAGTTRQFDSQLILIANSQLVSKTFILRCEL